MQLETAVAGAQVWFVAFDDRDNMGFHAVEGKVESAVTGGGVGERKFALADRQRRGAIAICQAYLVLALMPTPELEHPLPSAHRHPARDLPGRIRLVARGFRL